MLHQISGVWCGVDFDEDVRNRTNLGDLSMPVLEQLDMVVTACDLTILEENTPQHVGDAILMRGDKIPAVDWVDCCREGGCTAFWHGNTDMGVLGDR